MIGCKRQLILLLVAPLVLQQIHGYTSNDIKLSMSSKIVVEGLANSFDENNSFISAPIELEFEYPAPNSTLVSSVSYLGFLPSLSLAIDEGVKQFTQPLLCMMFSHESESRCQSISLATLDSDMVFPPPGHHHAIAWIQAEQIKTVFATTHYFVPSRNYPLVVAAGCEGTGHRLMNTLYVKEWTMSNSKNYFFNTGSYPFGYPVRMRPNFVPASPDKILLLWRDPKDAILSNTGRMYDGELTSALVSFITNQDAIFDQLASLSILPPCLRIDYNITIFHPQRVINDVAQFLELDVTTLSHQQQRKSSRKSSSSGDSSSTINSDTSSCKSLGEASCSMIGSDDDDDDDSLVKHLIKPGKTAKQDPQAVIQFPPLVEAMLATKLPVWNEKLNLYAPNVAGVQ
jgi:hypothetical protein